MFAVIYRAFIKPGLEDRYQKAWGAVATYFVAKRGALGSVLHQAEDGMWVAYSKWPDKATREISWPQEGAVASCEIPTEIQEAIRDLKGCIENSLPEICMNIRNNITPE